MFIDTVVAFDHVNHSMLVIANAMVNGVPAGRYHTAIQKIETVVKKLQTPSAGNGPHRPERTRPINPFKFFQGKNICEAVKELRTISRPAT